METAQKHTEEALDLTKAPDHPKGHLFLEKIKEKGWKELHEEMCKLGFTKPFQNFKFLNKTNGNVKEAIELI